MKKHISWKETAKFMVDNNWGQDQNSLEDSPHQLSDNHKVISLLILCADRLNKISKSLDILSEPIRERKIRKSEKERLERTKNTAPLRKRFNGFPKKVLGGRISRGILIAFNRYEKDNYWWELKILKDLLERPMREWSDKDILSLNNVGKKALSNFKERLNKK